MQRILIDMDDVMAQTGLKIMNKVNEHYGTNFTREQLLSDPIEKDEYQQKLLPIRNFLWEKGFFRDIPLMPDAQELTR